jgi:hypothetical protein
MQEEPTTQIVRADSAPRHQELPPPTSGIAPEEIRLDCRQLEAISMIIGGAALKSICAKLRINRSTLWRWRNIDPNFAAALNQWRATLLAGVSDRVHFLSNLAVNAVAGALREGNGQLGLRLLDRLGLLRAGATSPIDPFHIHGVGSEDEKQRHAAMDGLEIIVENVSAEQRARLVQLLARGIVEDDHRNGQASSHEILSLAGLNAEGKALANEDASQAGTKGLEGGSSADCGLGTRYSPLKVKARTVIQGRRRNSGVRVHAM